MIDDGSPVPLAKPAELEMQNIVWIRTENKGLGAARNQGLRNACGEFVAFLDSDDEWEPGKIDAQETCLDANINAVACYTQCVEGPGLFPFGPYPDPKLPADRLAALLWHGQFFPPSSVMVRREMALRAGGFREGLVNGEDLDMWFRLFEWGEIVGVSERLTRYRIHEGQITSNDLRKVMGSKEARRQIIERFGDRLQRGGISKERFWHAYRNEVFCVFYRRRFSAARTMLWDYWKDHPREWKALLYCAVSCMPAWMVTMLRGKI